MRNGGDFAYADAATAAYPALASGTSPPTSGQPPLRSLCTIADSTGATVKVPTTVTHIADSWPAHNEVLQLLGGGDKIVATVTTLAGVSAKTAT